MKYIKKILKMIIPYCEIDSKIYKLYKRANKRKNTPLLAQYYSFKIYRRYKCIISFGATILGKINFPHPTGIVIGAGANIGKNVTIYQNVTIGRKDKTTPDYPTIEDDVIIYCNSVLIGKIKIGKGAVIGAGSIILRDVKPGEIVFGIVK